MDVEICRVCRETSKSMVNIFDTIGILDKRISIADMISQCTGFRVFRGDPFPKFICASCKQDATNAYEIKQLYETSHKVFCQFQKDIEEEKDLLQEEISDYEDSETKKTPYKVKKDKIEIDDTRRADKHVRVKNEPVVEDEEDRLHISDCDVDQHEFQVKTEEFTEYFQTDDHRHEDKDHEDTDTDHEDKAEYPHKCSYCQKPFLHKSNLELHIRTHTGERPFKCSYCQKSFALNGTLQKHIRTHTGERPYKCSHCESSFRTIAPLQSHMRIHTGERPYKCSDCQKTFIQNRHLKDHMRTHTGERPYKCSQCPTAFSHKSSLLKHTRAHTGERPHKCSQKSCNKSFTRIDSLVEHMRSHTDERPFKCAHCQKGFTLRRYLQKHLRTHT